MHHRRKEEVAYLGIKFTMQARHRRILEALVRANGSWLHLDALKQCRRNGSVLYSSAVTGYLANLRAIFQDAFDLSAAEEPVPNESGYGRYRLDVELLRKAAKTGRPAGPSAEER